ncbi:MAG TPA: MFS transporter [Streptosporangiaceae bacterium]|jgi:CP family cyanate transporter-like MFS transporter
MSTPATSEPSVAAPVPAEQPGRARVVLLVIGIALAALNLRTAVTSVGPLLDEIRASLGMSGSVAGVLTTLPVLCFAVIGSTGPLLAHRFGERRVVAGAIVFLAAGLVLRSLVASVWLFLLFSAVALVGGALGNVLIPAIIKRSFPHKVGVMTAVYTTAMAIGTTLAAGIAVPIADAAGSWRVGVGVWFVLAVLALLPWLGLLRRDAHTADRPAAVTMRSLARSRLAWLMAAYFGSQSLQAYVAFGWIAQIFIDNGVSRQEAGLMLAVLTALSIPISLVLPSVAARMRSQFPLVVAMVMCYVAGYVGMIVAPGGGAWIWSVLIGLGAGAFPLALTMIALRSRHASTTAALSAFAQSIGYLTAGAGPLLFGVLHDLSGGWTVPYALVFAMLAVQLVTGWRVSRPRHIEDELPSMAGLR